MDNKEVGSIARVTALTSAFLFAGKLSLTWVGCSQKKRYHELELEIEKQRNIILRQDEIINDLLETRGLEEDLDVPKKSSQGAKTKDIH